MATPQQGPQNKLTKLHNHGHKISKQFTEADIRSNKPHIAIFHKTIGYNRLARKIAIANLGGPVKRKINWKEKKGKEKEGKTTILSYNK